MRLGIKGKQVLGVTSTVAAVVVVLSLLHLANLAHLSLQESKARAQLLAIYRGQGKNLEFRQRLLLGDKEFGSIRIGVSTLLIRSDLYASLSPAIATALVALGIAVAVAMLLAQLLLRPIHVIRSGL